MIICFHHDDHDGHTSGAIVKRKFPDALMIEVNHENKKVPWELIKRGDTVIVVDYSYPVQDMERMDSMCEFVWIDHHINAIKDAEAAKFNPKGIRKLGVAGCQLTWEFYFGSEPMPKIIDYIAQYDVYKFVDKKSDIVLSKQPFAQLTFQIEYGFRLYDTSPGNNSVWELVFSNNQDFIDQLRAQGEIIFKFKNITDANVILSNGFKAKFEGLNCLIANLSETDSLVFEEIWDEKAYDCMLGFTQKFDTLSVSMYTDRDDVDISPIIKKYGGGGHKSAGGFIIKTRESVFKALKLTDIQKV